MRANLISLLYYDMMDELLTAFYICKSNNMEITDLKSIINNKKNKTPCRLDGVELKILIFFIK